MKYYAINKRCLIVLFIINLLFLFSCGDQMKEISLNTDSLTKLSKNKIYFGHQSVGYNIMEGINDLSKANPQINIIIKETINPDEFNSPVFAHSTVGKNQNPESKVDTFVNLMKNGMGEKADIAFFKFCYVDIVSETDIKSIFNFYKNKMNKLQKEFPDVKFVHITVPITTNDRISYGFSNKIRSGIKKLLNRDTGKGVNITNNIKRNLFNEMLINEYKNNVFDLAMYESLSENGKREVYNTNNATFYALIKDYTSDGGHLNKKGRLIIASRLLEYLGNLD